MGICARKLLSGQQESSQPRGTTARSISSMPTKGATIEQGSHAQRSESTAVVSSVTVANDLGSMQARG